MPTPRNAACEVLEGLGLLFPSERYRLEFWRHDATFSARATNRSSGREYLAVWNASVPPESVIAAASEWQAQGEPPSGIHEEL